LYNDYIINKKTTSTKVSDRATHQGYYAWGGKLKYHHVCICSHILIIIIVENLEIHSNI
jgi:hypothetical protein